jgi:AcrR family transcriptional regulator
MKNEYLRRGRTAQKQKTREKILQAAHRLQHKGGEFTLEKVAERAGISRATIYRYYSNKDVLSAEAVLDMRTRSPEQILLDQKDGSLEEAFLGIQEYYNQLAQDNERAFRKYLSVLLDEDNQVNERGARRVRTLTGAMDKYEVPLSQEEKKKLVYLATLMMGIEALIVTRDVCRLDENESKEVLKWGLNTLLKGAFHQ